MKITLNQASNLSSILGKCAIKKLGNELFIPVIKAKASLSSAVKKYAELELSVFSELGFEGGVVPNGTPLETLKALSKAQKELSNQETEVEDIKLFTLDNLKQLSDENPTLNTSELEVLFELMVK